MRYMSFINDITALFYSNFSDNHSKLDDFGFAEASRDKLGFLNFTLLHNAFLSLLIDRLDEVASLLYS